mgnify:FL=1
MTQRPLLGVTCDLNDVYWSGQSQFAADILQWQRMGLSSVLLLSGDAARAHAVLPSADAAGFGVVCGGMTETKAYLDNGADTQAAADAVVAPIAALLALHPSLEALLVDDDGTTQPARVSRLLKVVDAYRRLLPGVPVVAANVGLNRAGPIQRQAGCDKLLLQCYPCGANTPEGALTMDGFGYAGMSMAEYVRTVQSEANEPIEGPHAPLWLIGQTHDFAPVPPSGFTLRRPTVDEVKAQYAEAWRLGAERVYWFNWHSRVEPTHAWTGLKDMPEHRRAIAELTGHVGVPSLRITDHAQSVEDWWASHPFNPEGSDYRSEIRIPDDALHLDVSAGYAGNLGAAIADAYAVAGIDGPCVLWLDTATYNAATINPAGFAGRAKNNVQLRAKPGATPTFTGLLRLLPVNEARDYSVWSLANSLNSMTNAGVPARQVIAQYPLKGWYVEGVTFDAQGASQSVSLSTCADIVFRGCTFQGITWPGSGHPGHVTGNSVLDNVWFVGCRFRGKYGWAGAGTKPVLHVYLDGLKGGGAIGCTFDDDSAGERDLLFLCNDDFSRDYDLDGVIGVPEHRMAQYVVSYGNVGGARYSHMDVTGRQWLVDRYRRTSGTMAFALVRADSKSNNIDNPPLSKWKYVYEGGVVTRCDVPGIGGTGYIVRHLAQNAGPYPGTIAPEIGRYTVADNILRSDGFARWAINEGPNAAGHVGPNVVANNATSGTIPPAVAWEPIPYAYLPPPDPLAEALALVAQLQGQLAAANSQVASLTTALAAAVAENAQLTTALANAQAELITRTVERDAAWAEVATLAAAIEAARSHWAALRAHLEAA